MKEGWTYKKLGDIAIIIHGKNQKDVISENGQYPIYGSGGNVMGYATDYLCEANTTILGRKGSINNPQFITERFWNVDTAFGIFAKNGNDSKFIYYFIKSIDWSKKNTGTTLPSLTQQIVKSVELSVPPLAEQERIVERLDAAFAQIDELKSNAEKQLAEARALFQSALTQAMQPKPGWQEKTLKEITTKIGSGATPKGGKAVYIENGVALVRSMNVHNGFFKYENLAHIRDEAANLLNGVELKQNDVLFNITGASIARCCVVPDDVLPARVNQHVAIIRPKADIVEPRFLSYVLISKTHQNVLLSIGLSGATRQALTKKDLENHIVSLPTNHKQKEILDILDNLSLKVRELEEINRKTAAECDAMKQALLRQIFE